jgi:hypothetical protein
MARVLEPLVEAATAPLRAELADTRTALEIARQEVGHLHAELEQAQERIRVLEAPRASAPDAPQRDSAGVSVETAQTPAPTSKREPWWAFWRTWTR